MEMWRWRGIREVRENEPTREMGAWRIRIIAPSSLDHRTLD